MQISDKQGHQSVAMEDWEEVGSCICFLPMGTKREHICLGAGECQKVNLLFVVGCLVGSTKGCRIAQISVCGQQSALFGNFVWVGDMIVGFELC